MKLKAQMEIMGLVIIVLLLSLGLLFVIRFIYLEDNPNVRVKHSESQLTANLLNSLLQTTAVDCQNQQIKSLFSDCASLNDIICYKDGNSFVRSCEFLEETVEEILESVLNTDDWKKDYYFNVSGTREQLGYTMEFGERCTGSYDSKFYPIQSAGRTIVVTLEVCGIN